MIEVESPMNSALTPACLAATHWAVKFGAVAAIDAL